MAVRRNTTKKVVTKTPEEIERVVVEDIKKVNTSKNKWWMWAGAAALLIIAFWYKTNSWPIVAMVGMRPITRFEVAQSLFKQKGKAAIDEIITEEMVMSDLAGKNINVSDAELNAKITEIRNTIPAGSTLEQELTTRGSSIADFSKQLRLHMRVEKRFAKEIAVTSDEVKAYIDQNKLYLTATDEAGKVIEATDALRMSKLQAQISSWITELKAKTKVWRVL